MNKGVVVIDRHHPPSTQIRAQVRTPIRNVSIRPDQYSLRRSDGLDNGPERALGLIENRLFSLRKALRSGPLSDEHLRDRVLLAGAQFYRGQNRTLMAKPFRKMMDSARADAAARSLDPDEAEAAFIQERIFNGDITHDPENLALLAGPKLIQIALDWFNKMYKCVLTSSASDFITLDEPVVLFDPVATAKRDRQALKHIPESRDCEVTYPLTRRHCLLMAYQRIVSEAEADDTIVETINSRTAKFCKDEIYVAPSDVHGQEAALRAITSPTAWLRSLALQFAMP